MSAKKLVPMVGAMVVVITLFVSKPAHAVPSVVCTVGNVAWTDSTGGTVQINCGGTWYYAFGSSGTCPTTSTDGKKAYMSLAQAALLSAKSLYIEYSTCTGGPGITYVRLVQ